MRNRRESRCLASILRYLRCIERQVDLANLLLLAPREQRQLAARCSWRHAPGLFSANGAVARCSRCQFALISLEPLSSRPPSIDKERAGQPEGEAEADGDPGK